MNMVDRKCKKWTEKVDRKSSTIKDEYGDLRYFVDYNR